ncbi:MAG TPA: TonB-dependent receptor [Terriglobia bacterium]|nr:TonB-dependent receptor [Terriglobia bacterium]
MKWLASLFLIVSFLVGTKVCPALPQASSSTAELRGQVTDPSGATVPGARVLLTDTAKGIERTAVTDVEGNYIFLEILPSAYELKVEASGFAPISTSFDLTVGQQAAVPIQLKLSPLSQTVRVVESAQVVDTERTDQSSVVRLQQITNLPINRRNYLDYALLTPGVTSSEVIVDASDPRVAQAPTSNLSFAGSNGRGNYIAVDGAETLTSNEAVATTLSQEAVQEFQVIRNSYNVEFGGAYGGVINIVSKSGSNAFHGSAFGLFRGKRFDAHNAFDFAPGGSPFSRQQYGGSLGGPVRKGKTFFFAAVERFNQSESSFVNLLQDPQEFQVTPSQAALFDFLDAGTPFAGASAALRGTLTTTLANYPRTINLFTGATGSFPFDSNQTTSSARLDHTFSPRDYAYARFNVNDAHFEDQAAGALTAVSRSRTLDTWNSGLLLSENHIFSPTTLNELKLQLGYIRFNVIPKDLIGPALDIEGFGFFGRDLFLPSRRLERHYDVLDNLSRVVGNHTFKFGGLLSVDVITNNDELFYGGRFDFGAAIPLAAVITGAPGLGPGFLSNLTSFLTANNAPLLNSLAAPINSLQAYDLGLPLLYEGGFGPSSQHGIPVQYAAYAQDTWKARPNFTLNYGLRYGFASDPYFVPFQTDAQPRLGFSWDPFSDGKTAIRGGAGIYAGTVDYNIAGVTSTLNGTGSPNNINIVLATGNSNLLGLPTSFAIYQTLLAQGVLGNRLVTTADLAQFGLTPGPGAPLEVRFRLGPDYQDPITYQSSLGIERDLGDGFSLEAEYLFAHGLHLPRNRDVNPFKETGPINPLTGQPTFIRFPTPAQAAAGLTSDFRDPLRLQDNQYESTANSFYNGLTISLQKRFSRHYSIYAHYTLSKAIDEQTDFNSDFSAQNPLNARADRALSDFDQRHRLVASGVFSSPFTGASRAGKLLEDWTVAPIFTAASGRPFNLLLGFDANNDGRPTTDRPGAAGRNTGHGEPFYSLDARLARRLPLGETRYLEFTLEAFNLFNHTNFLQINNVVGTTPLTTFAARGDRSLAPTQPLGFTSAADPREVQFGARFNF